MDARLLRIEDELDDPGRVAEVLFPDQVEAVERLVRHLRRPGTRGLFVSATGTGKTLVSVRVADGLGARLVPVRGADAGSGGADSFGLAPWP
ncbi:DEAD/DEAH box helicase family protein [Streptomyces sp. NPDC093586]|uniref:DEAD/DEAH box helicase family protein n=1 Tax=Streptomyces sp. NPDC093586 TaxID=3366042 RepID=UPI0037F5B746